MCVTGADRGGGHQAGTHTRTVSDGGTTVEAGQSSNTNNEANNKQLEDQLVCRMSIPSPRLCPPSALTVFYSLSHTPPSMSSMIRAPTDTPHTFACCNTVLSPASTHRTQNRRLSYRCRSRRNLRCACACPYRMSYCSHPSHPTTTSSSSMTVGYTGWSTAVV